MAKEVINHLRHAAHMFREHSRPEGMGIPGILTRAVLIAGVAAGGNAFVYRHNTSCSLIHIIDPSC